MLIVAIISYLLSLVINACPKRCINNYFTGLFHDLPEVLTRDIISPVKRSIEGLEELIKEYEKEQMEMEVYSLLPPNWLKDIKMYTEDEFLSTVTIDNETIKVTSDEISKKYNNDAFNPKDGEFIKAADDLSAYTEAYLALNNGVNSSGLREALSEIKEKYKNKVIAGVDFGMIYEGFNSAK